MSEIELHEVTADFAEAARLAYRRYGRRKHEASLNRGDCFAYALAKASGEALLFKGADFAKTDIPSAPPRPTLRRALRSSGAWRARGASTGSGRP